MDENILKKAAEYLRRGYTLTNVSCPKCNSPMFRDKKENLLCVVCGYSEKRVNEKDIYSKIKENLIEKLSNTEDIEEIYKILRILYLLKKLE